MKSSLYQDYDALAYRPHSLGEQRGAINHIKKAKQKTKGLEIVFDPKHHKDFVTGFRKRKQQRRKEANKQLEKKAKKQRVEQRAERRKELKQQLGLPDDYGVQDSDGEQDAEEGGEAAAASRAEVKQYQQAGYTTTVSITNFNAGYGSDEDADVPASDGDDGDAVVEGQDANSPEEAQPQQQRGHRPKHARKTGKHGSVSKKSRTGKKSAKARKR